MTCIAGVVEGGSVWMAGDSAASDGWTVQIRREPKVFLRGPALLGFTTSFRMGQLLRYRLAVPDLSVIRAQPSLEEFMATDFVDAVRTCLKDGGWAEREKEQESGGTFLVGIDSRLFAVHDDYQVAEQLHPYAAVGSGATVALGALAATQELDLHPQDRLQRALTAAATHCAGVRPPFEVAVLRPSEGT